MKENVFMGTQKAFNALGWNLSGREHKGMTVFPSRSLVATGRYLSVTTAHSTESGPGVVSSIPLAVPGQRIYSLFWVYLCDLIVFGYFPGILFVTKQTGYS